MQFLNNIQDFIKNLSKQDILKYLGILFAILSSVFALMLYLHYYRVSSYLQELDDVNKERKSTAAILAKNNLVVQQRQKVDAILKQDAQVFRIAEVFENIVKKLKLEGKRETKEILTTEGAVISDKIEQKLTIKLNNITTKDLIDLLQEISKVERLYPKELSIKKNNDKTINIEITIATLEPAPQK